MNIVRALVFLLVMPLMCACGAEKNPKPAASFEPELLPFYYAFVEDARRLGVDLSYGDDLMVLRFGEPGPGLAGRCDVLGIDEVNQISGDTKAVDSWKEITVRKPEAGGPDARYVALMYHELGHCLLAKDHVQNQLDIMYPSMPTLEATVRATWDQAVLRLFLGEEAASFPEGYATSLALDAIVGTAGAQACDWKAP